MLPINGETVLLIMSFMLHTLSNATWQNLTYFLVQKYLIYQPLYCRYMYWSDWREDGRIERASLDGTQRMQLIPSIGRAMGLTIDFSERKLYWTNVDSNDIECSDLDGGNRAVVLRELPYPFGLTQYQDYLYWTDWEKQTIEKANKTNGLNRTTIQDNLEYIMDISVFHASRQSGMMQKYTVLELSQSLIFICKFLESK